MRSYEQWSLKEDVKDAVENVVDYYAYLNEPHGFARRAGGVALFGLGFGSILGALSFGINSLMPQLPPTGPETLAAKVGEYASGAIGLGLGGAGTIGMILGVASETVVPFFYGFGEAAYLLGKHAAVKPIRARLNRSKVR